MDVRTPEDVMADLRREVPPDPPSLIYDTLCLVLIFAIFGAGLFFAAALI